MSNALRMACCLAIVCFMGSFAHAGDLEPYLTGAMAKLKLLEVPVSLADHQITYPDGSNHALKEKSGKVLLVNLWSKGCVPCKTEMKDFSNLQKDLGGDRFEAVALPMEKRGIGWARKILNSWGAENLHAYGNDPQALAGVLRIPVKWITHSGRSGSPIPVMWIRYSGDRDHSSEHSDAHACCLFSSRVRFCPASYSRA